MALTRDNLNKMETPKVELSIEGYSKSFVTFRVAQTTVREKKTDATKDDYIELCSLLLRNNLENWTHGRDPINNTARVVDKWAKLIRVDNMKMEPGLASLINRVVADPRTKTIYFSEKGKIQTLLIIVDQIDPDIELEYSKYYVECLRKFSDFYCDFMVYSFDEFKEINVQRHAEMIYQSGEFRNA